MSATCHGLCQHVMGYASMSWAVPTCHGLCQHVMGCASMSWAVPASLPSPPTFLPFYHPTKLMLSTRLKVRRQNEFYGGKKVKKGRGLLSGSKISFMKTKGVKHTGLLHHFLTDVLNGLIAQIHTYTALDMLRLLRPVSLLWAADVLEGAKHTLILHPGTITITKGDPPYPPSNFELYCQGCKDKLPTLTCLNMFMKFKKVWKRFGGYGGH